MGFQTSDIHTEQWLLCEFHPLSLGGISQSRAIFHDDDNRTHTATNGARGAVVPHKRTDGATVNAIPRKQAPLET